MKKTERSRLLQESELPEPAVLRPREQENGLPEPAVLRLREQVM